MNKLDYVAETGENGTSTSTVTVKDVQIWVKVKLDQSSADATERSKGEVDNLDVMYIGANGLTESWSGSNAEITYGHEAHRDMLIRYSDYTTTAPENWSALNTDRSLATWKIRWWALEPVELEKTLEQLQYEFWILCSSSVRMGQAHTSTLNNPANFPQCRHSIKMILTN